MKNWEQTSIFYVFYKKYLKILREWFKSVWKSRKTLLQSVVGHRTAESTHSRPDCENKFLLIPKKWFKWSWNLRIPFNELDRKHISFRHPMTTCLAKSQLIWLKNASEYKKTGVTVTWDLYWNVGRYITNF